MIPDLADEDPDGFTRPEEELSDRIRRGEEEAAPWGLRAGFELELDPNLERLESGE